jgi:bifunctional pyridoxal-dependent enzyme with beta-cystathionase and maltose regulon repressor activities
MEGVDPLSVAAIEKYEAALHKAERQGTRVRALLLCNPHNPLGKKPLTNANNLPLVTLFQAGVIPQRR